MDLWQPGIVTVVVAVVAGFAISAILIVLLTRKGRVVAAADPDAPNSTTRFTLARRNGYERGDVDGLLDQVYSMATSADGRSQALELCQSVRFHLARRGGYEPDPVDRLLDALISALATGRELPARPSTP